MLKGKVALVTGSSKGIGRSVALRLAKEGAYVGVNGTDKESIDSVVKEIDSFGGKAIGIKESVGTIEGGEQIVHTVLKEYGVIDILVNNAGITRDRMAINMTENEWNEVIGINLSGTFFCIRPTINHMKKRGQGGSILNMTSSAGLMGSMGQVNYSAAKAGILGITWTLSEELKRYDISVNAIAPAALTNMTKPIIEKIQARSIERNEAFPDFWKVGSPDDVANLVLYLSLEENREISGGVFSVNGNKVGLWERPKHKILFNQTMTPAELKEAFFRYFEKVDLTC